MVWNEQTIDWFDAASRYTGFHEKLAALLRPNITPGGCMVDVGCGPGLIDFALSPSVRAITCVDLNAEVVAQVAARARARGIGNIEARCADARALSGCWDDVLMVFFGRPDVDMARWLALCKNRVIAVVRMDARHPGSNTLARTCAALARAGIASTVTTHAFQYGQPFTTREAAVAFVRLYEKCAPGESEAQYLDRALVPLDQGPYRYYLPNLKRFGIITVGRKENEHLV
ncbi:MAG: class I SAM-dependent methyltransferase [Clostridia bacterium]